MAITGIDLQDPSLTDYPGTGLVTDGILFAQDPATGISHRLPASRLGSTTTSTPTTPTSPTPTTTTRVLGDVPTAKALAVIQAYKDNGGPVVESNTQYYHQYFIDDFTEPGDVFKYCCDVWRPASADQPTVWKWGRYLEAGM
jgi:hypothetical protein